MDTLLVTLVDRLAARLQRRGILLPTVQREALSALVACGLLMLLWHLTVRGLDLLGVGLMAMTILLVPAAARRWRAVHADTQAPWSDALAHEYTERANHWRARFIGRYINLFTGDRATAQCLIRRSEPAYYLVISASQTAKPF